MPITGSQQAPKHAQFGTLRFGAFRFGYHSPKVCVSVGGTHRAFGKPTATHLLSDLTINETSSASPNRASFTARGWKPTVGMEVIATLGSKNRIKRLFAGTVLSVVEGNDGTPDAQVFEAQAVDWTWTLNREPVFGHYTGSADAIALELMADYAPSGFTTTNVETGLATVDGGITFTNVDLSSALTQLAKRIGAKTYIDYQKDLYFRVTDLAMLTNPTKLVEGLSTLKHFTIDRDLSQVFTRVSMEGGGSTAAVEIAVGETIIALLEAPDTWYGDVGGTVLSGPQKITYTGRVEGGGGSLVGPGVAPSSAPTLALANGAGMTSGSHDVTVVFVTASGRSLPSPVATITVGNIEAPTTAPTRAAATAGGSVDAGDHDYVMTYVTAVGETTPSPVSAIATVRPQPTAAPTFALGSAYTDGSTGSEFLGQLAYVYVYDDGTESGLSPESAQVTITANTGWNATVPSTQPTGVTSRRLYMRVGANYSRYANLAFSDPSSFSNTTGNEGNGFRDRRLTANGSPTGTAKQTIPLTLTTSPLGNVTNRKLYRRFNSTGTHKLVTTLNNVVTSYNDTAANSALGADAPSTNTATANQVSVSAIPIGASSVTERELYMSPAGGGARKRALTIANNTATTGTITMSDATLASQLAEPASDTSGLTQPTGVVAPGSTSLVVAGLAPFLSTGGVALTGTQLIRYTGFTGSSLTGIPASGPGSIQQAISYNSTIAAAPCLTGIPASGDGSILYTIPKGQDVNCFVTANDATAQAALLALVGGDGIKEKVLQDRRLSRTEALARATAYLELRKNTRDTANYLSKDMNTSRGTRIIVDLEAPTSVDDIFAIQSVTISNFTPNIPPDYTVQASDELVSIEDLLNKEP